MEDCAAISNKEWRSPCTDVEWFPGVSTSRFGDSLELTGFSIWSCSQLRLITKNIKQSGKERGASEKSRGNHSQASKSPLSVKSHTLTFLWAQIVTARGKCCLLGKFVRTQDFYWGLVTWGSSGQHIPKSQTSRKKARVYYKPHCYVGTITFLQTRIYC